MDHWLQIQFLIERFSTKRSIIRTSFPGWNVYSDAASRHGSIFASPGEWL